MGHIRGTDHGRETGCSRDTGGRETGGRETGAGGQEVDEWRE